MGYRSCQFFGLLRREIHRFCKVPLQTVGSPILSATLYLLIFGINLGGKIDLNNNLPYIFFLIPGLVSLGVIRNAFDNGASAIVIAKMTEELQDLRVAPFSLHQLAWAKGLSSLIRGIIVALLTYLCGQLFSISIFHRLLPIYHLPLLLFFTFAGGLSFALLGVAVGLYAKSFEYVGAMGALILLPLIYLGGVFFPLSHLSPFWTIVSACNPLFYIINGIRYSFIGQTDSSLLLSCLFTIGFLVISYLVAISALNKGSNFSR